FVYEYPLASVQVSVDEAVLGRGETAQLMMTGTDTNAGDVNMDHATIVYSSSDPDIVSVSEAGVVTAESLGTASVTAAVTVNGVTREGSVSIEVVPSDDELLYNINDTMFVYHGTWDASTGAGK